MVDFRFMRIRYAAQRLYPDGVVVYDGEKKYGFRKSPQGGLHAVHFALVGILEQTYPVVQAEDILPKEASMTDNPQPQALTSEQAEELQSALKWFHKGVMRAQSEYNKLLKREYEQYAYALTRAGIDVQQYPAPPIDQERA